MASGPCSRAHALASRSYSGKRLEPDFAALRRPHAMTSFKKITTTPLQSCSPLSSSTSLASTSPHTPFYFSTGASSLDSLLFSGHGIPSSSLVTLLPRPRSSSAHEHQPARSELALDDAWLTGVFLSVAKNGLALGDAVVWIDAGLDPTQNPTELLRASEREKKNPSKSLSSREPIHASASASASASSSVNSIVESTARLKIAWRYGHADTGSPYHKALSQSVTSKTSISFDNFHYYSVLHQRWTLHDVLQKAREALRSRGRVRVLISHLESPAIAPLPPSVFPDLDVTRLLLELKRMMAVPDQPSPNRASSAMVLVSLFPGSDPPSALYYLSDYVAQREQQQIVRILKAGRHPMHLNGWKPGACQSFWHFKASLSAGSSIEIMPLSLPPEGESTLAGSPSPNGSSGFASSYRGPRAVVAAQQQAAQPAPSHDHGQSYGGCGSGKPGWHSSSPLDF